MMNQIRASRFGLAARLVMAVLALGVLAVSGCNQESTGGSDAGGKHVLKLGLYGSLTGPTATFGRSTEAGVKLAVEEANAKGGVTNAGTKYTIELISDDTEGKADKAGTVVTKLVAKDHVVAVLGEVASSISLKGAPVCQQFGVPMLSPSSTNPEVTKVGDMIFRCCYIDPFQGSCCAEFAWKNLHAKSVAVLYDQTSAYSVGLKDEFEKTFKKLGGTVAMDLAYTQGATDFNAQLTRIREAKPDVIFVPVYYTDVARIAVQARQLGITQPMLGGDGWDSDELAKNAGKAIDGCYFANHYAPDQPSAVVKAFVKHYQEKVGVVPDCMAALGYDAANMMLDAISRAKSLKGSDIRDALAETKDFKGVTGNITINAQRDADKPLVIVERKDGKWVYRTGFKPNGEELKNDEGTK